MSTKYLVAVHLVDKAYGGPEEGGWWYQTGEHVRTLRVFGCNERAVTYARRLDRLLDATLNKGRRPISSVLSEGRYEADVFEHVVPEHYPATKPHYE
jgi:hypothetical protein